MKQRYSRKILILVVVILAAEGVFADDINVSAELSSSRMAFESKDTLVIKITWDGPPDLYTIENVPQPILENLAITGTATGSANRTDSISGSREISSRTYSYILEPVLNGVGTVNPVNITAVNKKSGEKHALATGKLTVQIAKPVPVEPKRKSHLSRYLIVPGIIIVVAGGLIYMFSTKRKNLAKREKPMTYRDKLEIIKAQTSDTPKLFYTRLYDLLLEYLEHELHLNVAGKTGEEVVQMVASLENEATRSRFTLWLKQISEQKYRPDSLRAVPIAGIFADVARYFDEKQ